MKLFKKRWHRLPIGILTAVLVACLLAGSVFAAYQVFTSTTEVSVLEPLEVTEIQPPGTFWDWRNPDEPIQTDIEIYAGMDIGAAGYGGKYFVLNLSPQPVSVTVTVTEASGQMDWYGLAIYYSNGWHATDTCNWDNPIVTSDENNFYTTFTFDIGSVTYPTPLPSADVGADSNQIKFFVNGKVASDADPLEPLDFTVTVKRG